MVSRRDIRMLALQGLFLLDSYGGDGDGDVAKIISEAPFVDEPGDIAMKRGGGKKGQVPEFSDEDKAESMGIATAAWDMHDKADVLSRELAPTWPPDRQPAVDRAIVRLAYYEMASGLTDAKIAINEAIELAKIFGTERSPAFINGVLDKMMRKLRDDKPTQATEAEKDE